LIDRNFCKINCDGLVVKEFAFAHFADDNFVTFTFCDVALVVDDVSIFCFPPIVARRIREIDFEFSRRRRRPIVVCRLGVRVVRNVFDLRVEIFDDDDSFGRRLVEAVFGLKYHFVISRSGLMVVVHQGVVEQPFDLKINSLNKILYDKSLKFGKKHEKIGSENI
jgi:hypothetical protein